MCPHSAFSYSAIISWLWAVADKAQGRHYPYCLVGNLFRARNDRPSPCCCLVLSLDNLLLSQVARRGPAPGCAYKPRVLVFVKSEER